MRPARITETVAGILGLARLGLDTRFRLRGRYWRWRLETALGGDRDAWPSAGNRRRSMLRYGAWARRLRRLSKD